MECKEFEFSIFYQIPCNHICDLPKREIEIFLQQKCHHSDENIKREEGGLGTNYIQ
jgi:hypothetical protein